MPDTITDFLDSRAYTDLRYRDIKPAMAFPGGSAEKVGDWKRAARSKLLELLGGFPAEKIALEPVYGPVVPKAGYSRQTVTFRTRAGMASFGYLLLPEKRVGKVPTVICIPGHGRGADDLVGLTEDGKERDHKDGYQHDYAIQCVEKGYVALAIEPIGFGHRRNAASRKAGAGVSSCLPTAGAALMLGETIIGWRVWDAIRSIDFLETRPEVDRSRIAMMGISGGGTITLYAAALDERIKASVLSCSFCTFKDSIYSVAHCIDNYAPGILKWFEVADLAGLIAPRFLFAENGLEDTIFPEPGVHEALLRSQAIYEAQGARTHIDHHFFQGGHVFDGTKVFPRLREWLGS